MPMVLDSIAREIKHAREGKKAMVRAKLNALIDPEVIEALYEASQAGVEVELIIRGVCALRPGVKGLSENIRVCSVIGRFLEHSRIYYFYNNGIDDVWLSSADWMQRNLRRRVEIAFPILDSAAKRRAIDEGLLVHFDENPSAWEMDADGDYQRQTQDGPTDALRLIRGSQSESQNQLLKRLSEFNET